MSEEFIIGFKGGTERDANLNAEKLKNAILDACKDVEVDQRRADEYAQDFGSILVIVLGTRAVTVLAKAVEDWLKLHHGVEIDIKTRDGRIHAKNVTAENAQELAQLLRGGGQHTDKH